MVLIMGQMKLDLEKYGEVARQAIAEGQVLLRNEQNTLPLPKNAKLAVFGRMQFHYYKSGTGSGGMVNVDTVTGILDAFIEHKDIAVNQQLIEKYRQWEQSHPFNEGVGWGQEPWSQEEMSLSDEMVKQAAQESDYALIIIARTAGEDKDNQNLPGSYLLTQTEEEMLRKVREHFSKMIVILNVGNVIDMSFVDTYKPEAVLYAWQGGMLGGLGTVDILTGVVSPSGKLADTIAYKIEDYPSDKNFGNLTEGIYEEDIYVGYRYFETVAKEKVRYPFGFGLSYTEFQMTPSDFKLGKDTVHFNVTVKNIGKCSGKEVVQVYVQAPQGQLGKPAKVLSTFAKTKELQSGEEETISIKIPFYDFASYDEAGVSGFASAYVLEKGEYIVWVGNSVRNLQEVDKFTFSENILLDELTQAMAPIKQFNRMKPAYNGAGELFMSDEQVNCAKLLPAQKRLYYLSDELTPTGDKGYQLADVMEQKVTMEDFIAQLSDEDLACIIRGEGMGSPKVTPGTAAAFGGVSDRLKQFGIPCGCCSDGPSGMRLDSGVKAFSLPNGTLFACTFNEALMEELFAFTGIEMAKNRVDTLLGPGMNIHRHPLNGRNFEYFSEDPLLTGKMAANQIKGLHKAGVTGCIKHFCANNQELSRHDIDCVISERALREIYLKGYEIAIKEGGGDAVMTTYGSVNGLYTAGNYDLNTVILRDEWGFKGIVMTDWRAKVNDAGQPGNRTNLAAMAKAQNDIYMVCQESDKNSSGDNTIEELNAGSLTRGELQRNAMNICYFLMKTHAFERMNGETTQVEVIGGTEAYREAEQEVSFLPVSKEIIINLEGKKTSKGSNIVLALDLETVGDYRVELTASSKLGELAQMPVTLFYQSVPFAVFTFFGTEGKWETIERTVELHAKYAVIRLYFNQNGLDVKEIKFTFLKSMADKEKEKNEASFWGVE